MVDESATAVELIEQLQQTRERLDECEAELHEFVQSQLEDEVHRIERVEQISSLKEFTVVIGRGISRDGLDNLDDVFDGLEVSHVDTDESGNLELLFSEP